MRVYVGGKAYDVYFWGSRRRVFTAKGEGEYVGIYRGGGDPAREVEKLVKGTP